MRNKLPITIALLFGAILVTIVIVIVNKQVYNAKTNVTPPSLGVPTPIPIQAGSNKNYYTNTFEGITPNVSTRATILEKLGNPKGVSRQGGFEVLSYQADNTLRQNKFYVSRDRVSYVVEEVTRDNSFLNDFLAKYHKNLGNILYDPKELNSGFNWYVFPEDGVAFLANSINGYTIRMQYFPVMSYQEYLNTVAKEFSLVVSPPPPQD